MQRREIAGFGINKIITGAIVVAVALGATAFYLFYTGRFGGGNKIKITPPADLSYEWTSLAANNNIVSDYLYSRSKSLLVEKGGDGVLAATSYTIAGRLVSEEATNSGIYSLSDQALLLKCYVRSGDRNNAVALKDQVKKRFQLPDGSYLSYVYSEETEGKEMIVSQAAMIDWLDAMLEYYVTYGSEADYKEIKILIETLFDNQGRLRTEKIVIARYAESLYVSLEDTSEIDASEYGSLEQQYGTITGDADSALIDSKEVTEDVEGVLLSNINLRLIRDLENNGLITAGAYDKALKAVKDGYAGSGYSFYAYATSGAMDCDDYIYSGRNIGAFDIAQNIKTMRNLAEVHELDSSSFAEFKGMVINSGRIYTEFVMLTGNYSGQEAIGSYMDGMMMAYYMGDKTLYDKLSEMLGTRVATRSTSPALYMIFREEGERYVFYSRENFYTRIATW